MRTVAEVFKALLDLKKKCRTRAERERDNFEKDHQLVGVYRTPNVKGGPLVNKVAYWRYVGWGRKSKYSGADIRRLAGRGKEWRRRQMALARRTPVK